MVVCKGVVTVVAMMIIFVVVTGSSIGLRTVVIVCAEVNSDNGSDGKMIATVTIVAVAVDCDMEGDIIPRTIILCIYSSSLPVGYNLVSHEEVKKESYQEVLL